MNKILKQTIAITLVLCCIFSAAGAFAPSFAYESINEQLNMMFSQKTGGKISIEYNNYMVFCDSMSETLTKVDAIVSNEHGGSINADSFRIKLQQDITESVFFSDFSGRHYEIDLNGHTWTSSGCCLAFTGYMGSMLTLRSSKSGGKMVGGKGYSGGGTLSGGCLMMNGCSLVVKDGITFTAGGNKTAYPLCGGAIFMQNIYDTVNMDITGATFDNCKAEYGGAVYSRDCNVSLKQVTITSCSADKAGGALYVDNAHAAIADGTVIAGCSASAGGAVYFTDMDSKDGSGTLSFKDSSRIVNCSADNGGGIYLREEACLDMMNSAYIENCVAGNGGGIYINCKNGVANLWDNARIKSCTAVKTSSAGNGGAVYVFSGKLTTRDNAAITSCVADGCGSAVYLLNAVCEGVFKDNTLISNCPNEGITIEGGYAYFYDGKYKTNIALGTFGWYSAYGGWYSKKVENPAEGLLATNEVPFAPDKDAPYTVTTKLVNANFYSNNGTQAVKTYSKIPAGMFELPLPGFTKTDCDFAGWAIGSPSGDVMQPNDVFDIQSNTDFYALWTPGANAERTINFIDPVSNDSYAMKFRGRTAKVETLSSRFKRDNYHISGYNTQRDGNGTAVPAGSTVDLGTEMETTLYVMWEGNLNIGGDSSGTTGVYTVTFTDSTSSSKNADYVFKSQNTSMILMDNGFVRTGEVLGGWATMPNGWGKIYQLGDRYTFPSPNSTLYAYWVAKDVDTYHAGESGQSSATEIVIVIDPSQSESEKEGGKGGKESNFNTIVFYDPTGVNKAVTLKTYDKTTMIYAGGFRRSGYNLSGWNTQANGRGIDYKNGEEYTFGNGNELVLYAMWTVNKNDVIEGESGSGASQDVIDAYKNKENPPADWDPTKGDGGRIEDVPSNWKEIYDDRPYYDVEKGKYYYDAVIWADKEGAISGIIGIDADKFNPEAPCTRADMVTLLWEVAGEPQPKNVQSKFTDVPAGTYYSKAVAWGAEQGIVQGIGDNKMDPEGIVTRSQALTFLWRYHGSPAATGTTKFNDLVKGSWYETAVKWGVAKDITNGTAVNKFSPEQICSRGEIVTFLFRDFAGVQ